MASSTDNLYVGKGIVSFTPKGGTKYDMGNCTSMSWEATLEELEHFTSRAGVRTKDKSIILSKSGTISITLEEFMSENLELAFLGTSTADTVGGGFSIDVFSTNAIEGELEFVGTNEVGPKITAVFYNVSFKPGSAINLLSDEWGSMELTGEALAAPDGANAGKIGLVTVVPQTAA